MLKSHKTLLNYNSCTFRAIDVFPSWEFIKKKIVPVNNK